MKIIRLNEYLDNNDSELKYETEYKNELISLNIKYSQKLSSQVMLGWLEASADIMRDKAKIEKNKK